MKGMRSLDHEYSPLLSVADAEQRLIDWDYKDEATEDLPNFIVMSICGEGGKNLSGSANTYHNLASEFARNDLYEHAKRIAISGAAKYTYNVDLLADIVKFGYTSQDWECCQKAYERLQGIDSKKWTWRTFSFVVEYLLNKIESLRDGDAEDIYTEVLKHIENYKLLNDERAWVAESNLYLSRGERDKAKAALKDGIEKVAVSPKCCLKLADICLENGKYEEVIQYAAIGIKGTAQEQPSVSTGYLFYISALAKDALIFQNEMDKSGQDDEKKGFANQIAVNDALTDYQIALNLLWGQRIYTENIQQRMVILKMKSGVESTISQDDMTQDQLKVSTERPYSNKVDK